jgi:Fe-S-cluster containining protein
MNPHVRAAYREFDVAAAQLVKRARTEVSVPCAAGCSACCYDVAWVLQPEVDEIAERVRSMPTAKRERAVERTRAWLAGMRAAGLDPDDVRPDLRTYHRARLACPLLEDDRCTVYDLRPLSCRAHYVVAPDASGCANRAEEPTITTLEMPDLLAATLARMIDGKLARVRKMRDHLLPRLLGDVLGVESLPERK